MTTTTEPTRPRTHEPTGKKVCHLRRVEDARDLAACGVRMAGTHPNRIVFEPGMTTCPVHGAPVCPRCRRIVETWLRSEAWEGP